MLSLIEAKRFDQVVLFSTPSVAQRTGETTAALASRHPEIAVHTVELALPDPTDYLGILRGLRQHTRQIVSRNPDADYFVAVASGTPQMHACWVMLVSGGELPAKILHVRPPKYVTKELPMVSEVDLSSPEFPEIRAPLVLMESTREYYGVRPIGFDAALQEVGIVGEHPSFVKALKMASVLAGHTMPVLIQGETGTGKELAAKLIHRLSPREAGPLIPVNCGAMPENLIESLLFGHRKGAFTGATTDVAGKFEQADGGTLFLDEIGELPVELQPRLLRVLEDGVIDPLGAKKPRKVDVRVIAATNRDLEAAMDAGAFREDLYYRLSCGMICLPSLRERRTDIPLLTLHLLDKFNRSLKRPKTLKPDALARLQEQRWQGNVRDLENVLGRSLMMSTRDSLGADDLLITSSRRRRDALSALPEPHDGFSLEDYLKSVRKQMILRALEMSGNNQSQAASLLGISSQAVHKFVKNERDG